MARKVFDCADVAEELSGGCRVAVLAEDVETLVESSCGTPSQLMGSRTPPRPGRGSAPVSRTRPSG